MTKYFLNIRKVKLIEAAQGEGRYCEVCKVSNKVMGRKKSKKVQVEEASPQARVATWFTHFQKLLGTSPIVDDSGDDIPSVFTDLEINDGPYNDNEYVKVKSSL